jgi:hypothetical protein
MRGEANARFIVTSLTKTPNNTLAAVHRDRSPIILASESLTDQLYGKCWILL